MPIMATTKREKTNLACSLRKWALEDMHFHTSSYNRKALPTEKNFESLCRGPLSNVWEYLLDHIRSTEYVKEVRGNLALHKTTQKTVRHGGQDDEDDGHDQLRSRKQRLEAEKKTCLADVSMVEMELKQVSKLLEESTQAYEKAVLRAKNLQRKKCLLTVAWQHSDEKVAEYQEYVNRLEGHAGVVKKKRKEADKMNYLTYGVQDFHGDMETESCRDIRLVCESTGQYLHQALSANGDRQAVEDLKSEVMQGIDDLHSSYTMHTITDSLVSHTIACSKLLREDTVRVNIASDAKDLSFLMDNKGHLHDESKPPSVQKSVQKLLQESHLNHVMRWFEEQNHLNESWKTEAQLDNMKSEIHKLIVKSMGGNPNLVRQAEAYADLLLHLASEQAVAPVLKQEVEILLGRVAKAKDEQEELRSKFGKIQEFKKIVEMKQNILGSLAHHNSVAPGRLDRQREQCKSYMSIRPVHSHLDLVEKITSDLYGSLLKETDKFHPLPFVCFLNIALNGRTSVLDLSMAPSAIPGAHACLQTYSLLCQALQFPNFKSPDRLMAHILQMQAAIQESHRQQVKTASDRRVMCEKAGVQDDPSRHMDLLRRSGEQDRQLQESLVPRLKGLEELALKWGKKLTESIPKSVEAWWEQPAQHTTPWLAAEGFTYEQWMQRFRVILTQVHKKHVERQRAQ